MDLIPNINKVLFIAFLVFATLGIPIQKQIMDQQKQQMHPTKQQNEREKQNFKANIKQTQIQRKSQIQIQQNQPPIILTIKQSLQSYFPQGRENIDIVYQNLKMGGDFIKSYWNLFKKQIKYGLILIWLQESHRSHYQKSKFVEISSELILIFFGLVFSLIFFIGFLKFLGFRNNGIRDGSLAALIHSILVVIAGGSLFAVFQMIGAIGILFFITRKAGRIIFAIMFLVLIWLIIFQQDSSVGSQL